jgi:hypothetical protein
MVSENRLISRANAKWSKEKKMEKNKNDYNKAATTLKNKNVDKYQSVFLP